MGSLKLKVQGHMSELAPGSRAMLRGLSGEERQVLHRCLDEFDGLTAGRQLTVSGLDGSELQLPLEDYMTAEDLRKSVAERIGLRLLGSSLRRFIFCLVGSKRILFRIFFQTVLGQPRLGGTLVLAAGGNALNDSTPLLEQVHGDVLTYVVQQVALGMFMFS